MKIWKIVGATLVIFIAGIVTGVVLVRLGERGPKLWNRPLREAFSHVPPKSQGTNIPPQPNPNRPINSGTGKPSAMNREFVPILDRQLRLTSDQREQIEQIMKTAQEKIRDLRLRIEPDIRKEMQRAQEQIRAVLTEEQLEQYQRLMKRQQRRNELSPAPDRRPREPKAPQEFHPPRTPPPPSDDAPDPEPQRP